MIILKVMMFFCTKCMHISRNHLLRGQFYKLRNFLRLLLLQDFIIPLKISHLSVRNFGNPGRKLTDKIKFTFCFALSSRLLSISELNCVYTNLHVFVAASM